MHLVFRAESGNTELLLFPKHNGKLEVIIKKVKPGDTAYYKQVLDKREVDQLKQFLDLL